MSSVSARACACVYRHVAVIYDCPRETCVGGFAQANMSCWVSAAYPPYASYVDWLRALACNITPESLKALTTCSTLERKRKTHREVLSAHAP